MGLFDDIKAKADANGDGKITKDDIDDLKNTFDTYSKQLENLRGIADSNGDGKIDMKDIQGAVDKLDTLGKLGSVLGSGTAAKSVKKKK